VSRTLKPPSGPRAIKRPVAVVDASLLLVCCCGKWALVITMEELNEFRGTLRADTGEFRFADKLQIFGKCAKSA
jgi:hypothetical protein